MVERDPAELQAERDLAAKLYPAEWASASRMTGRKGQARRARLRQQAVYEMRLRPLREAGASCLTCANRTKVGGVGQTCDIDSDFHGYAVIKDPSTQLCTDWADRGMTPANAASLYAEYQEKK